MFVYNDTATTEIYTLSLHDALPIFEVLIDPAREHRHLPVTEERPDRVGDPLEEVPVVGDHDERAGPDRKSTRLNSSHANISYAVFCLTKKRARDRQARGRGHGHRSD